MPLDNHSFLFFQYFRYLGHLPRPFCSDQKTDTFERNPAQMFIRSYHSLCLKRQSTAMSRQLQIDYLKSPHQNLGFRCRGTTSCHCDADPDLESLLSFISGLSWCQQQFLQFYFGIGRRLRWCHVGGYFRLARFCNACSLNRSQSLWPRAQNGHPFRAHWHLGPHQNQSISRVF